MSRGLDRRATASWALYDFANSAFTTLVVTFVYAAYYTQEMAHDEIEGTALWSRGVTITAVLVAVASPFLGALADRGGLRKRFLLATTVVCVGATVALFFPEPGGDDAIVAIAIFVVANVAFELGGVFYNAFLPDVAPPELLGRVSGWGWALGYGGGLLCMVVALFGFVFPDPPWFGLSTDAGEHIRATNLLVAAWFAVFCLPMFLFVKEARVEAPSTGVLRATAKQLADTFRSLADYRQIGRLLLARLIYNDGLVTVFAFGGVYAAGTFDFELEDILIFGIVLNVTAGIGAFAMGFLDDRLGGKKTLLITLAGLAAGALLGAVAPNRETFWVAGVIIGVFSGPNQSASRSLLARFVPRDKENEFFGFFAFSGKATAFLGPLLFGLLTEAFESQRAGLAVVLVSFAIGAVLLSRVDEAEGIARRSENEG
ncbi:MAG: MFS transporter [Myxococcales bacterium]|nr:MFS transporter [Myxococcales bacterium]